MRANDIRKWEGGGREGKEIQNDGREKRERETGERE